MINFGVKADVIGSDVRMKIADVPDNTKIAEIDRVGVKSIELVVTDFIQNLNVSTSGAVGKRFMQTIWSNVTGSDTLKKRANMIGRLRLSRGRFSKDEIQRDEWLTLVGREVAETGPSNGYTIVLADDRKISNKKLRKSQSAKLRRYANSFCYEHAKQALIKFYQDELEPIL